MLVLCTHMAISIREISKAFESRYFSGTNAYHIWALFQECLRILFLLSYIIYFKASCYFFLQFNGIIASLSRNYAPPSPHLSVHDTVKASQSLPTRHDLEIALNKHMIISVGNANLHSKWSKYCTGIEK